MAGKSKGKNKGRTLNSDSLSSAESQLKPLDSSALSHDGSGAVEASNGDANGVEGASRTPATDGSVGDKAQKGDAPATATKQAEGVFFYFQFVEVLPFIYPCLFFGDQVIFLSKRSNFCVFISLLVDVHDHNVGEGC